MTQPPKRTLVKAQKRMSEAPAPRQNESVPDEFKPRRTLPLTESLEQQITMKKKPVNPKVK